MKHQSVIKMQRSGADNAILVVDTFAVEVHCMIVFSAVSGSIGVLSFPFVSLSFFLSWSLLESLE